MKQMVRAALVLAMSCMAGQAFAAGVFMPTGARATQPVGHWEFCQSHPDECRPAGGSTAPVTLTRAIWKEALDVNGAVNLAVEPRTDDEMWGREEVWSYPEGYGDCEDYVLEKRRDLMALGVPAASLLITVVRQENGDGHAVLTLRTDRGDFVLDNLEPRVLRWSETGYTFLKRQSERSPGAWVSIESGRPVAVGSVR